MQQSVSECGEAVPTVYDGGTLNELFIISCFRITINCVLCQILDLLKLSIDHHSVVFHKNIAKPHSDLSETPEAWLGSFSTSTSLFSHCKILRVMSKIAINYRTKPCIPFKRLKLWNKTEHIWSTSKVKLRLQVIEKIMDFFPKRYKNNLKKILSHKMFL